MLEADGVALSLAVFCDLACKGDGAVLAAGASHRNGQLALALLDIEGQGVFQQMLNPLCQEGKSELTIAVGCTGGKHRSITFARKIAEYCEGQGYAVSLQHRDATR